MRHVLREIIGGVVVATVVAALFIVAAVVLITISDGGDVPHVGKHELAVLGMPPFFAAWSLWIARRFVFAGVARCHVTSAFVVVAAIVLNRLMIFGADVDAGLRSDVTTDWTLLDWCDGLLQHALWLVMRGEASSALHLEGFAREASESPFSWFWQNVYALVLGVVVTEVVRRAYRSGRAFNRCESALCMAAEAREPPAHRWGGSQRP